MPHLRIILDGDGAFAQELSGRTVHHVTEPFTIAGLAQGMASGKPSVAFMIPLPDGSVVVAETSLALLVSASRTLVARHGDPTREGVHEHH